MTRGVSLRGGGREKGHPQVKGGEGVLLQGSGPHIPLADPTWSLYWLPFAPKGQSLGVLLCHGKGWAWV